MRRPSATTFAPPPKFETLEFAEEWRQDTIDHLLGLTDTRAVALVQQLSSCAEETPCLSWACHVCMRRFRMHTAEEVCRVLADFDQVYWVTIVPAGIRRPVGELASFDLPKFIASARRALERALPLELIVLGGVDITLNWEDGQLWWVPHLHALVASTLEGGLSQQDRQSLRGALPLAKVPRPTRIEVVKDGELARPATYLITTYFEQWPSHWRLRGDAKTEALLFLGTHRPNDRLLFKGARRFGSPHRFTLKLV